MTMPATGLPIVQPARPLIMPCPICGGDAEWNWARADFAGDGTRYTIDCPACARRPPRQETT